MTFPHVGLLKAEGLTAKALAFVAKRELEKEFFKNAKVIVALEPRCMGSCPAPPHGPSFTIFGQVVRQGRYELVKGETLTIVEAIARAGGLNIAAKGEGKLIRKTAKGTNSTIFDVKSLTKNNSEKEVIVQDRDVLILFER